MAHAPLLYEINTRIWLAELSSRLGRPATFHDVPDAELDRLAEWGFDWIWLLGVWQTGPASRAVSRGTAAWQEEFRRTLPDLTPDDVAGSLFAVQDYRVHEAFGGTEALQSLRRRLATRGLRLMLDFVPNHTALDHPWVHAHPQRYILAPEGESAPPDRFVPLETARGPRLFALAKDPFFPPWLDVVQLNTRSRDCRAALTAELQRVAEQCDGVRCDMAMLLENDVVESTWGRLARPDDGSPPCDEPFWPAAIAAVRATHPGFLFLAEVYWDREWSLQQQGFDFTYDKRLYDRLRHPDAAGVRAHLAASLDFQSRLVRFLENHDEERAASQFRPETYRAAAAVACFVPGLKLFHEGQLEGRTVRVSMHLQRRPAEAPREDWAAFHRRLLKLAAQPALRGGLWKLLRAHRAWPGNESASQIVAWSWESAAPGRGERWLFAVNLSPHPAQAYVEFPWHPAVEEVRLSDRYPPWPGAGNGEEAPACMRDVRGLRQRGLYLDVPGWAVHAFEAEEA